MTVARGFEFLEDLTDSEFLSVVRDERPLTIATILNQLRPSIRRRFSDILPPPLRQKIQPLLDGRPAADSILPLLRTVLWARVASLGTELRSGRDEHSSNSDATAGEPMTGSAGGLSPRPGPASADTNADLSPTRTRPAEPTPVARPRPGIRPRADSPSERRRQDPGVTGFNAIAHLPARHVRAFLNQVPHDELAIAFIGAEPAVKERLLDQMVPEERALLSESLRLLGPVRQERTDRERSRLARLVPQPDSYWPTGTQLPTAPSAP